MAQKYKNPKKPNIVSFRVTDDEMAEVQKLMDATSKRASDLMREAYQLLRAEWARAGLAVPAGDSEPVASCL